MRTLTACLLAALLFAACEEPAEPAAPAEPEPEVVVPEKPAAIIEGVDDLIGPWVITEQAGTAPEDVYFVTFTREGEYIIRNEAGVTKRSTFHPAGDHLIAVTDSSGTRRFAYDVDGRNLTLSVPGTETRTILERRDENY